MNLCEVYTSVQGEGPNTGRPITFVRFGGCNLRCAGWGTGKLPDGTTVGGCDTVFAVYPEWRDHWTSNGPGHIRYLIPETPRRVCLTGGEPLIQRSSDLKLLAQILTDDGFEMDLFTNGTQDITKHPWVYQDNVTVVMDFKLPGSGEYGKFYGTNWEQLGEKDAIKFVCKDRHDFDVAMAEYELHPTDAQIWFGPVWGVLDPDALADWIRVEIPTARLNIQTHKYIWHPDERKV